MENSQKKGRKKGPRAIRNRLIPLSEKYDDILDQQEALGEQLEQNGAENYQKLFVKETKKGAGYWFLVFLIVVATVALINSLPIDWGQLLPI